ncbi:MAG: hypothetical protein HYZ48_02430, partial [Chlamydiales bacterium]|nr:hypothetical protein [Chlamydiales bacterium]
GSSKKEVIHLPQTDMLLLRLQDGSKLVIRPSGTEPKLKIYASTHLEIRTDIPLGIQECDKKIASMIANLTELDFFHTSRGT